MMTDLNSDLSFGLCSRVALGIQVHMYSNSRASELFKYELWGFQIQKDWGSVKVCAPFISETHTSSYHPLLHVLFE